MINVNSGVNNYGGVPLIGANTLANRPAASIRGRLFVDTTNNLLQYDTGFAWVTIGGAGSLSGSGAAGQATFWTAASTISGDNLFHWDNTNKRLGLGTAAPGVRLDIHGTGVIQQLNGTGTNNAYLDFQNAGTTQWRVGNTYNGALQTFTIIDTATSFNSIAILKTGQMLFNSRDLSIVTGLPNPYIQFIRESQTSNFSLISYANVANESRFDFQKTRGTTKGTFANTLSGDDLGSINFYGSSTTGWLGGSYIICKQNGVVGASTLPTNLVFHTSTSLIQQIQLTLDNSGYSTFSSRLNVNNATDNALFELNNNGNFYTGGLSPTILTVSSNTTMARTVTGYYCTATLTLTLPSAASLNNVYWVIAGSGVTVTVNRAGSDDILNLAGTSVTSITISPNQRAMFYVGGGTRTFLISQA
jgi:hypothetical protein